MKNKELFEKTVGVLAKAYLDDTLVYTSPCGCAVGNLCAAAAGLKIVKHKGDLLWQDNENKLKSSFWTGLIDCGENRLDVGFNDLPKKVQKQIQSEIGPTGYEPLELAKIEYAFYLGWYENISTINWRDKRQFDGLCKVYGILCEIHEINRNEVAEPELVFVK